MGTPKIIAISNQNASNSNFNSTVEKDSVMYGVSSVVEIFLRITRDVRLTRAYKRKHTLLSI
jgi:hypothetical protein